MADILQECQAALQSTNMQAFLRVIRAGESSQTDDAYRTIVGGSKFDSFADHPRSPVYIKSLNVTSTAAGAFQFLARTWDECAKALGLPNFKPANQDLAAVYLIRRRGALKSVLEGFFQVAVKLCAKEWASLPESPYGQPTRTMAQALATYREYGGKLSDEMSAINVDKTTADCPEKQTNTPAEPAAPIVTPIVSPGGYMPAGEFIPENPMPLPAIIGAVLPSIIESIPKLGKLFGSGSEVAERNVKAAEMAVGIVQQAVGAVNAQDAAEKLKADPSLAAAATKAVESQWLSLSEAGGDGIAGARAADVAFVAASSKWYDFLKSPSFLVALLLVPLVYLIVLSLIGMVGSATWSDDVRAGLAGSIISAIVGGLVGYYFGQTTSRNRT